MRRFLAALVAWSIALTCTPVTALPAGSASPGIAEKPAINEQTRGEIQALLQKQVSAIAGKDAVAFQSTIDQDRRALLRCANENYDIGSRTGTGGAGQVGKIEPYLNAYVRAWVQEGANGQRRLFFRKINGKWVQSEPVEAELGGEKKTMVEDVQIEYWGVDQDAVDAFARGSVASKQVVLASLLSDNRRDALIVRFYPTRDVAGIQRCAVAGYHLENVASDPAIRIVRYWFLPSGELAPFTLSILSHEWLHWAQDQFSPGIGARLPWWAQEGWPDFVANVRRDLACQSTWPTLKQLEDGPDAFGPPEVLPQYYGFANTMVEYLYANYGGKAAYTKMLLAFKDDAVPANVFPRVFGITSQKFFDDWAAWARKKYC